MKSHRTSPSLLCPLIVTLFASSLPPSPQLNALSAAPQNKRTAEALKLPPFSIFGLEPSDNSKEVEKPFDAKELEEFLAAIGKEERKNRKENGYYWIIPNVFYQLRTLFSKEAWTDEEIMKGQQASHFFARLVNNPDLTIEKTDQGSFASGLVALRNWFASLCGDNKTLSAMIFTLDDGPFFGENVAVTNYSKMKVVESAPISDQHASIVLMTDAIQPNPMIIGVLNDDKSVRWLKRYSNPPNRIACAELQKPAVFKVAGYGYAVALMTEGTSGRERSSASSRPTRTARATPVSARASATRAQTRCGIRRLRVAAAVP
jgi:hypothetical protein